MSIAPLPYGRQWIDTGDIEAVSAVLRSDWLTTGPKVEEFEHAVATFVGAQEGVAVSSGTAALHAALAAAGIGPDDEVIVPPLTFVATANAVVFQGARPVFADVDPETLLIDPQAVQARITSQTKAIIAVDYAGQPCDYDALRTLADRYGLILIADACHALGAAYKDRRVGTLADLSIFSFHPVKHITTGEGGMVTTNDCALAAFMRRFRNHGISCDLHERERQGSWQYEVTEVGYNYRLSDVQCALGVSQLRRLPDWLEQRQFLADCYRRALAVLPGVRPLRVQEHVSHAYHLYVVRLEGSPAGVDRRHVFSELRARGIGVNVHYIPVHLQPYYQQHFLTKPGDCPVAEQAYERILSLPIFPAMSAHDVERVTEAITAAVPWERAA